jgi:tRNA modification GTPase
LFTNSGVRLANPGEFTLRAYLNNKKDLSQAEAVSDLIASESKEAHRIAMEQMRGGYSDEIEVLREKLIHFKSLIELELDFSEEDVEFADRSDLKSLLNELENKLSSLIESFSYGNVIKEGVTVTIAGKPNAGKSSLLNAIVNEDKAIVSDIPGTTRDAIEDITTINGIKFRFIDTAGIRETSDKIESIGVEKAKSKIGTSRILIYLFDRSDITEKELIKEVKSYERDDLQIYLVENKIDLLKDSNTDSYKENIKSLINQNNINFHRISALNSDLVSELKEMISKNLNLSSQSNTIISNSRHLEALNNSLKAIDSVKSGLKDGLSGDLLSIDLNDAIINMSIITGKIDIDQDILGSIFSKFCIGK